MKKLVLFPVMLICLSCFSQKTTRIDNYVLPIELREEKLVVVEMPFGKADILNITGDTFGLKDPGDIFVDVICTDYPSGHSLKALNQKRLTTFLKSFPFLTHKRFAQINFFRQMDGAEKEKAINMFHGLVIRYRQRQDHEAMKNDLANLEQLIVSIEMDSVPAIKKSKENRDSILYLLKLKRGLLPKKDGPVKYESSPWDISATGYDKTRRSTLDSILFISPKKALRRGLISRSAYNAYNWTPWITLYFRRIGDTSVRIQKGAQDQELAVSDTLKENKITAIPDSTLLKVFARTKWKNFSVVGDVTVSMYPYSAQLLLWIKIHGTGSFTNNFAFFNDGDDMPDDEKKIGSTGGIYFKDCESFDQVKKLIKETMEKGNGGDLPENDIEALLITEKEFPGSDFQVLIADNKAPIKDKILSNKLTKPVRIILCGANAYDINVDYLNLARQTKGSVHLMEQDIYNLASLPDGAELKIGKKNYKIDHGSFIETGTIDR